MEFNNRLYDLRKKSGYSQEELANRLNVSRQTISKWEVGDSSPDMEKLIAISDLFNVSLDELVKGETVTSNVETQENVNKRISEIKLSDESRVRAKKIMKWVAIVLGVFVTIDVISFIIYVCAYGLPK